MNSRMPKGLLPLMILVLGVVGAVLLIKLKPEPPKRPAVRHLPSVQVRRVSGDAPRVDVEGYGSVAARRRISLAPQVSGVVKSTGEGLRTGGVFARGDVLVRIDEADYRLAVENARAQVAAKEYALAQAEQEAEIARREWERIRQDGDADEPHALVLHGPQLKLARADLEAARAALAKAELDLSRCTLRAPFDGRVVEENVDAGQLVMTGGPLATIYATDVAEVTVPLTDSDLAFFDHPDADGGGGARVEVAADFAGRRHVWPGRVVRLSGALDQRTRLVDAVVALDDGYEARDGRPAILEGMFTDVTILGRVLVGAVALPRSALRDGGVVWVLDGEDRLRLREVTVARTDRETVLVTSGLRQGERVVVSALEIATEGMEVRTSERAEAGGSDEPVAAGGAS